RVSRAFSPPGGTLMSPSGVGLLTATSATCGQQVPSNDHALNFAGAFVDREHARVAIHALDVALARVTHAAVNLHGLIGHAIGHLGGEKFRARSKSTEAARPRVARGVSHMGRLPDEQPSRFDLRVH